MKLDNHSEIVDYPINFNLYPKMKNINFIEIDLNKNEYLFIPSNWIHWVITEPKTIAISFEIKKMNNNNTILFNKYKNNHYYIGKGLNTEFNYDSFMLDNKNKTFRILFSEFDDCSPVIKNNNNNKYFKETTLERGYLESNKKNYYTYLGAGDANRINVIKSINNYIDILEKDIFYRKFLWLSLDKKIHSGMHYDSDNKILYVLEGRKKILLLPPSNINNIYLKDLNLANNLITDDNNLSEYDSNGNNIFLKDLTNYSITDNNNLLEDYSSKNNEKSNTYFYGIIIIIIILIILWYYIIL